MAEYFKSQMNREVILAQRVKLQITGGIFTQNFKSQMNQCVIFFNEHVKFQMYEDVNLTENVKSQMSEDVIILTYDHNL